MARPPSSRSTIPRSPARSIRRRASSASSVSAEVSRHLRAYGKRRRPWVVRVPPPCRCPTPSAASARRSQTAATSSSSWPPTLIAFDTTAREVGDPPRDEAALQEYLAERPARRRAPRSTCWSPTPTRWRARRWCPPGLDFAGRPQLIATLRGARRRPILLFNGHIDVVSGEPRGAWTSDPFTARGPRRQAVRARRLRHEGRRRGDGVRRPRRSRALGIDAGRRPARGDQHRRGVLGRGRHARWCERGLRADAGIVTEPTGLPHLGGLPRLGVRRDPRARPARPRRGAPARLAPRRRGQRDREGGRRARRDRLAARASGPRDDALRPSRTCRARRCCRRWRAAASGRSPTRPRAT